MNIKDNHLNRHRYQDKIMIAVGLVSVMILGFIGGSLQQTHAFDLGDFNSFGGGSNIGLGNECQAIECNSEQTVDNSKTISNNINSNIVSESSNTNIGTKGNTSQPVVFTCVQCFEKAKLTLEQQEALFELAQRTSYEELCSFISQTPPEQMVLILVHIGLNQQEAQALTNCLVKAGALQETL